MTPFTEMGQWSSCRFEKIKNFIFKKIYLFILRGRVRGEGERESREDSPLSAEPNAGFNLGLKFMTLRS